MSAAGRSPLPSLLALAVTGLLALALWGALFWHVGLTAASTMTAREATGEVIACPTEPLGPGCTVRYDDEFGIVERPIDRPGLIGVAHGDHVPVWIGAGGVLTVAGWRPWADAALLLVLAVTTTGGAIHWFGRVLRAGDGYTPQDLGEGWGSGRGRRAG